MTDSSVAVSDGSQEHEYVQLVSAVRANLDGLAACDAGKKISQKRAHQLFPAVSKKSLERRCKLSPCNWRFHQAVRNVNFEDKPSVKEQCTAVLDKHPDGAPTTFLLAEEEKALSARVKDALASSGALESWRTLSSWARDIALANDSGIVIPESWLKTQDSYQWAVRFFHGLDLDAGCIPEGFFHAAPSTAARKPSAGAEGNSACGENEKPSPSGSKQPTPTTTAAEKSNQSAANQEKKGRQAAQAAPAKIRLFDFASYSGPQVPVIPDSGNPEECTNEENEETEGDALKRSAPCTGEKENGPAKKAKVDTQQEKNSPPPDKSSAPAAVETQPQNPLGELNNNIPTA